MTVEEMTGLTKEQIDAKVEETKKEIGELHPTVQNMLNLLTAAGWGVVNMLCEAIEDPEKFKKDMDNEGSKDCIKTICSFFIGTLKCAAPLTDQEVGRSMMMSIIMTKQMMENGVKLKKDNKNADKPAEKKEGEEAK